MKTCIINDNTQKYNMLNISKYVNKTFGVTISLKKLTKEKLSQLPFFLKEIYNYWSAFFLDTHFIFVEKKDKKNITPQQYKKHLEAIEKTLKTKVIFVFLELETYNRNRLIQKQISFIIPGKQSFIPNLFIDLKDYLKTTKQSQLSLQPAAQLLLLYHLQKSSLQNFGYKTAAELLKYSYVTITRAVENLISLNLCKVSSSKKKQFIFETDNKILWEKALSFLKSPIKKTVYLNDKIPDKFLVETNISALSHYTDINNNSKKHFAINHKDFTNLHKDGIIKMYSEYDGDYCIEVWKYDPKILSKDRKIDPLSLFLIFKESEDQRIKIELENLINKISW